MHMLTSNHYNYIITYLQGMFGEFLADQISQDQAFIDNSTSTSHRKNNRHAYRGTIRHLYKELTIGAYPKHDLAALGFNVGPPYYVPCTEKQVKFIDYATRNKSSVDLTHFYWPDHTHLINIPRHKKVFFYVKPEQVPYPFVMGALKAWAKKFNSISLDTNYGRIQDRVKVKEGHILLIDRYLFNSCYKSTEMREFIEEAYNLYYTRATHGYEERYRKDGWIYLNPMDLMTNPKDNIELWQNAFNMKQPLNDINLISNHLRNEQLIFKAFKKSSKQLFESDWKNQLSIHLNNISVLKRYKTF